MRPDTRWTALALVLSLAGPRAAQEGGGGGGAPPLPPPITQGALSDEDLARQLQQLFLSVERNLKHIDDMLNDASAGDAPLGAVEDSGLDDLLKDTRASSKTVVQDIDKILELACQRGRTQQGQGTGQGQPKPDGSSPLDQARDRGPREGESTPEKPSGEKPEDAQGQKPDSPAGSKDPGATRAGQPNEPKRGDAVPPGTDADEWGMLPAKVQEIFRNDGAGDVPVQYRDWIDAYYRRLNRGGR